MIPRVLVDRADMPDGSGELRLIRRGDEYSIMLGANELMNSRKSGSEEELARIACARLGQAPNVLIGGLGMGFTLRAALAALGPKAKLVVAELVPAVVRWAEGPLAGIFAGSLEDPRVEIVEADVAALIGRGGWDAILLDVDNGPDGLSIASNDRLYGAAGLAATKQALRPGGILGVWSAAPDQAFGRRLRQAGFTVEEVQARAGRGGRGGHHMLWFATKR